MLRPPEESAPAYTEVRLRLTEVLADVSDHDAGSTEVPACPDWTVTDVLAHLYGIQMDILEGNLAGAGSTEWTGEQIRRFGPLGLEELVHRWNETSPQVEAMGAAFPAQAMAQLVFDAASHEHDIRGALDRAGAREADSVVVGLTFLENALEGMVDAQHLPAIELDSPVFATTIGTGPPGLRLSSSTFELFRVFGGRRSDSQIRALPWEGDLDPYLTFFGDAPVQPPARPLIE
jgi:uncharacterized protein (TIGR03083 family)